MAGQTLIGGVASYLGQIARGEHELGRRARCPEIGYYGSQRRVGDDTHERRLELAGEVAVGELGDYEGSVVHGVPVGGISITERLARLRRLAYGRGHG